MYIKSKHPVPSPPSNTPGTEVSTTLTIGNESESESESNRKTTNSYPLPPLHLKSGREVVCSVIDRGGDPARIEWTNSARMRSIHLNIGGRNLPLLFVRSSQKLALPHPALPHLAFRSRGKPELISIVLNSRSRTSLPHFEKEILVGRLISPRITLLALRSISPYRTRNDHVGCDEERTAYTITPLLATALALRGSHHHMALYELSRTVTFTVSFRRRQGEGYLDVHEWRFSASYGKPPPDLRYIWHPSWLWLRHCHGLEIEGASRISRCRWVDGQQSLNHCGTQRSHYTLKLILAPTLAQYHSLIDTPWKHINDKILISAMINCVIPFDVILI